MTDGRRHGTPRPEADPEWLDRMTTRRVPLDRWHEALVRGPNDVKPVIVP